jgi:hypothetical protein
MGFWRKRGSKRKPAVEQLESRQLLSVFTNPAGDRIRIYGTPWNDVVSVTVSGTDLLINDSGTTSTFQVAQIRRILFNGGAGDDRIELPSTLNIPLVFRGGAGSDTAIGGAGNDTLYGEGGSDLLIGNGGNNEIRGAGGNDRIIGGPGNDSLFGGAGNNLINGGGGTDFIDRSKGSNQINTGSAALVSHDIKATYKSLTFMSNVSGYDPLQIRNAYDFPDLSTSNLNGAGQTIYIVLAFSAQDLVGDVARFSDQFDLPIPAAASNDFATAKAANGTFNLSIVNASGHAPAVDPDSAGELDLDVQWAHAMAPKANIVVVQADSWMTFDVINAVQTAASMSEAAGGGVVSMSFKLNALDDVPPVGFQSIDQIFATSTHTTFVAASGDIGGSLNYPAASPYVTSVGGTTLPLDQDGNRIGDETGWDGSGGGQTAIYTVPGYQTGVSVATRVGQALLTNRGIPDVAYDSDPNTGFAVYVGTPQNRDTGWFTIGGTSAAAPQWAALIALMNQRRAQLGKGTVGNTLNGALYEAYKNGDFDAPGSAMLDIITGTAGTNNCGPGYDLVTGIGTPDASLLIEKVATFVPFYVQQAFNFTTSVYMPFFSDQTENYASQPLAARPRSGSGLMSGSDNVLLSFTTTNTDWYSDTFGMARGDTYNAISTFGVTQLGTPVQLFRTGAGSTSGRIYGFGDALMVSVDPGITTQPLDFFLKFDGTWWVGTDNLIHFHVGFVSVDRNTGQPLNKNALSRTGLTSVSITLPTGGLDAGPYGGYMEGSLDG